MVTPAASTKTPTLSYAERAKKAQNIKPPNSIRQQPSSSSSVASPSVSTPTTAKLSSNPKSPSIDVSVAPAAGPSTSTTIQTPISAITNVMNGESSKPKDTDTTSTTAVASAPSPSKTATTTLPASSSSTAPSKPPVENVWNRRKEQMASKATASTSSRPSITSPPSSEATSSNPALTSPNVDDPFIVKVPHHMRQSQPPSVHDKESWPEVGKSVSPLELKEGPGVSGNGNGKGKEEPPTPRKAGEKPKWVPIPPEELQAAADAQLKSFSSTRQHSRSHSRTHSQQNAQLGAPLGIKPSRSTNHSQNPSLGGSQVGSQVQSRTQSGRNSVSHSRIASRSASVQSSPRFARGARLDDDSAFIVNPSPNINNTSTNNSVSSSPYAPPSTAPTGSSGIGVPGAVPPSTAAGPIAGGQSGHASGTSSPQPQPMLYVDTTGAIPLSYPTPLYGPVPLATQAPYYPHHPHPQVVPPVQQHSPMQHTPLQQTPNLPNQQLPSAQAYRHSPLSTPYVLPPGPGISRYNPNHSHSHSPIPLPPSQPPSVYPSAGPPPAHPGMYPPYMYMPDYGQSPAGPYPYWNGVGYGPLAPHVPGTQSPPYAPHMIPYPPPLHMVQQQLDHQQRHQSATPDEQPVLLQPPPPPPPPPPPQQQHPSQSNGSANVPPPTMIDHPPPPEESQPVAGYREVRPNVDGEVLERPVVFGSIGIPGSSQCPSPAPPASTIGHGKGEGKEGQENGEETLEKAFTMFSIGVKPDEPTPPRLRSRTRSEKGKSKLGINGDIAKPTTMEDTPATKQTIDNSTPPKSPTENGMQVIDLTDSTETKWQFGSTAVASPPLEQTEAARTSLSENPVQPLGTATPSGSLPPLPLDLQPAPHMNLVVGEQRLPPPFQPHPQPPQPHAQVPEQRDEEDDLAVKDFGYGFGVASGSGYATMIAQEERMVREKQREVEAIREQEIREDRMRWREIELEMERGSAVGRGGREGGSGRERDGREGDFGVMGRPRRGSYGGYGYDRGGYERGYERGYGRRGRPGGYARGFHRSRASFHAAPQARQPPFTVTPPPRWEPLVPYGPGEAAGVNGYYQPQIPQQHPGMATYMPAHPQQVGGYESYVPQPPQQDVTTPPHVALQPQQPASAVSTAGGAGGVAGAHTHVSPPLPMPLSPLSFPLDPTRYYLLGQLEYYLSPQNMVQDFFLRQKMDSKGWIDISLIASFKRVQALTSDFQLVKDVLTLSQLVQVNGNWVRMNEWKTFVLPTASESTVEDYPAEHSYSQSHSHSHSYSQLHPHSHSVPDQPGTEHAGGSEHGDVNEGEDEGDVEDDEEEEDVVFVIDDESQRWSPDRRQT